MTRTLHPASDARLITKRLRNALIKTYGADSTIGESKTSLLLDIADPSSPTGHRSFTITVDEIDRPEDTGVTEIVVPVTGTSDYGQDEPDAQTRSDADDAIVRLDEQRSVAPNVRDWLARRDRDRAETLLNNAERQVLVWMKVPAPGVLTTDVISRCVADPNTSDLSHVDVVAALDSLDRHGLVTYSTSTGWVAVR